MRIPTHALARLTLALSALGLAACGAPWQVLQQSGPPSALKGAQSITVGFDYSQVSLGGRTEEVFLAGRSEEDRAKFQEVKAKADQGFIDRLAEVMGGVEVQPESGVADLDLVVEYTLLEQGKYAVFYAAPSVLKANLVFSRGGQVVDAIYVETVVKASVYRPSILQRMGVAGYNLATLASRYFKESQTRQR